MLAAALDPVPCPQCGWYQSNMIGAAKKRYASWMSALGIICFVSAAIASPAFCCFFPHLSEEDTFTGRNLFFFAWAGSLVSGAMLFIIRALLSGCYEPNRSSTNARIALGHKLSISADQYEALRREEEARALAKKENEERKRKIWERRRRGHF